MICIAGCVCVCSYIYIYVCVCVCVCVCIYIYIYIYTHTHILPSSGLGSEQCLEIYCCTAFPKRYKILAEI